VRGGGSVGRPGSGKKGGGAQGNWGLGVGHFTHLDPMSHRLEWENFPRIEQYSKETDDFQNFLRKPLRHSFRNKGKQTKGTWVQTLNSFFSELSV
jgi:hypothetical protein